MDLSGGSNFSQPNFQEDGVFLQGRLKLFGGDGGTPDKKRKKKKNWYMICTPLVYSILTKSINNIYLPQYFNYKSDSFLQDICGSAPHYPYTPGDLVSWKCLQIFCIYSQNIYNFPTYTATDSAPQCLALNNIYYQFHLQLLYCVRYLFVGRICVMISF